MMRKLLNLKKKCKILCDIPDKRHPRRSHFYEKEIIQYIPSEKESFDSEKVVECVKCSELMKTMTFGNFVIF